MTVFMELCKTSQLKYGALKSLKGKTFLFQETVTDIDVVRAYSVSKKITDRQSFSRSGRNWHAMKIVMSQRFYKQLSERKKICSIKNKKKQLY